MQKKLPVILAVIMLLILGAFAFGCVRTATSDGSGSQVDANEGIDDEIKDPDDGGEELDDEGTDEEAEADVSEEYTPGDGPRVIMETTKGRIVLELFPDVAPKTVESFQKLIGQKFYDGLTFHRYVPGFVIQGGDPKGDGTGGPGYTVPAEFSDRKHMHGTLSMARSQDPNSAGSQFYIVLSREQAKHLDGQYTIFGHVAEGLENADQLRQGDVMNTVTMQEESNE